MKCKYCDGTGVSSYSPHEWKYPCTICDGKGEYLSNNDWLNRLPVHEKAEFMINAINECGRCIDGDTHVSRDLFKCGVRCPVDSVESMEAWLTDPYRE